MQEEVTSKTIALAIKTAKLDGKVLQAALRQFMQLYRKKRDTPHRGKQMTKHKSILNNGGNLWISLTAQLTYCRHS